MSKEMYFGVDDIARRVKDIYIGDDNNIARRITDGYFGVDNIARQFYRRPYSINFEFRNQDSSSRTLYDSFYGIDNGTWRFYLDSSGSITDSDTAYNICAYITGNLSGKSISITSKIYSSDAYNETYSPIKINEYWIDEASSWNDVIIMTSTTSKTYTATLSSGIQGVRVGIWNGSYGRSQKELIISSLKIGNEELII